MPQANTFLFVLSLALLCWSFAAAFDSLRVQLFSNGESTEGVDIELSFADCVAAKEENIAKVLIDKTSTSDEYAVLPQVSIYLPEIDTLIKNTVYVLTFDFKFRFSMVRRCV